MPFSRLGKVFHFFELYFICKIEIMIIFQSKDYLWVK